MLIFCIWTFLIFPTNASCIFFFLFWTNSTLWNSTVDLLLRSLFTKWKQRPEKSEMLVLWIIRTKFHSAIHLKGWKESHKVVVAYSLYQAEGQLEKFSEHLKKCLKTSKVCKFEMSFFFFYPQNIAFMLPVFLVGYV